MADEHEAAKLRWAGGAQRPFGVAMRPKTGARSAWARTRGQNPLDGCHKQSPVSPSSPSLFLWRPKNTSKIKRRRLPNRRVASLYSILFASGRSCITGSVEQHNCTSFHPHCRMQIGPASPDQWSSTAAIVFTCTEGRSHTARPVEQHSFSSFHLHCM
jgi:hypothetical protein